jgi:hypothetical protein
LIAPAALAAAAGLLVLVSVPPWFDRIYGEEYPIAASGVIIGLAQLALAAAMPFARWAIVLGATAAAISFIANAFMLVVALGSPLGPGHAAFVLSAALYLLVVVAALVEPWPGASSETAPPRFV